MSAIGNNLNQIARSINKLSLIDGREVVFILLSIESEIKRIRNDFNNTQSWRRLE
ncbi:MAG: plasmid mobilization relaxosome protein MobC [Halopseudomonas sp.]